VQEAQRTRILEAMAEALAERSGGVSAVTIEHVIERAGVSRDAFAELFADRETCLVAAFDLAVERAGTHVLPAYESESRWLDAVKAALAAFLRFLEEEPALGRLAVVHAMGGGELVLRRRMEVLSVLGGVIDRGRQETPAGRRPPPPVIAEGVVGAVLAVIQNRMLAEDREPMIGLFGSLASVIVLPYLGSAVARRELLRPAPRVRVAGEGLSERAERMSARQAGVRLTYRTARVLGAIADYPGASNREVAERAGIVDQGQVSKLLGRLEARDLIVKIGEGRSRGAPNAWRLTERGEDVLRAALTNRSGR
jgi:AcrR family transcriptional regulator